MPRGKSDGLAMRTLCLIVACVGLRAALAQEAAPSAADVAVGSVAAPAPAPGGDDIVVQGRAPENLRLEIERLETAVYSRFNALNSNDELDIRCLERAPTGSNIPQRTCAPEFVIRAESRAARKMITDARASSANNVERADRDRRLQEKGRELMEEMQRIAREDEQLLRDLTRLAELKELQQAQATSPDSPQR